MGKGEGREGGKEEGRAGGKGRRKGQEGGKFDETLFVLWKLRIFLGIFSK